MKERARLQLQDALRAEQAATKIRITAEECLSEAVAEYENTCAESHHTAGSFVEE